MPSTLENKLLEALTEFSEAIKSDEPLASLLVVRRVEWPVGPNLFTPQRVKKARKSLGANLADFAAFLGVTVKTVKAWEKGVKSPNRMACRFLAEIQQQPDLFRSRLKQLAG